MPYNARPSSSRISTSTSWSIESLESDQKVIRKVINSAIYVEKPIIPPLRKKSLVFMDCSSGGDTQRSTRRSRYEKDIKRCTCNTSHESCPCHTSKKQDSANTSGLGGDLRYAKKFDLSEESSSSDTSSQITVKSGEASRAGNRVEYASKLSSSPLRSQRYMDLHPEEKEDVIKSWLKKKDEEKKRKENEEAKVKAQTKEEKQAQLKKEKENFKKWLENKKAQEEKANKEKDRKQQEKQTKEQEKQRKQKESEASFNLWLKRKKRHELERKIKEKLASLQMYDEKQKRIEENEKAFNEWLENSKNKPKPLPLNQGLDSFCSSTSVTYINPVRWIPNVEETRAT
nr:unnamed protein product [Callosobruchus chinensis]